VLISGKVEQQRGLQVIVDNWQLADQFPKPTGQLFLRLQPNQDDATVQKQILGLLRQSPGPNPVLIYSVSAHRTVELNSQYWVSENAELFGALTTLLGRDNVVMKNAIP
jgi:DNA polymerase-3 subunit alpha